MPPRLTVRPQITPSRFNFIKFHRNPTLVDPPIYSTYREIETFLRTHRDTWILITMTTNHGVSWTVTMLPQSPLFRSVQKVSKSQVLKKHFMQTNKTLWIYVTKTQTIRTTLAQAKFKNLDFGLFILKNTCFFDSNRIV